MEEFTMKLISLVTGALLLSGCSVNVVEMAPEPTNQTFDLSDAEGDGVITARDKCLDTTKGSAINNDGCGDVLIETLRADLLVNFAQDSDVVERQYYGGIQTLSEFMTEYPTSTVIIEGHTSLTGTAAHNKKLSFARANAVKQVLMNEYNIDSARIATIGYGFERPLINSRDDQANAKNRRIEAQIASDVKVTNLKWTIYSVDKQAQ
jgi:outer membrane protein OmpA-like peptidoglycan-associated protein